MRLKPNAPFNWDSAKSLRLRRDVQAIVREKLHSFGYAFWAGTWYVDAVTLVVVRGRSEVPPINTVGGPGAAVVRCLVDYDLGDGRC